MSLPLFAQDKKENDNTSSDIQAKEWMTKISSDPEMRDAMITMILDETNGNKEEMSNLAKTIMDNPGMNSIISGMMQRNTKSNDMTVPSLDMMRDSTNAKFGFFALERSNHFVRYNRNRKYNATVVIITGL
jgi:hypothetical protein